VFDKQNWLAKAYKEKASAKAVKKFNSRTMAREPFE
jgi:hypothetical protein